MEIRLPSLLQKNKKIFWPLIFAGITGLIISGYLLFGYSSPFRLYRPLVDSDEFKNPAPVLPSTTLIQTPVSFHVPILMYHYVEHVKDPGDTIRKKLDILPETLDHQLQTLQDNGYTFMYISEVADVLSGKEALPAKPIVLTFDDGYQDFYTDALPILEKHHAKATAYIISGFLGKRNYMSVEQLLAVEQSGIVEIAAHTMHHIDLQHANIVKAAQEIMGSKTALENLLHIPIPAFAYPGGRFNPDTVKLVANAGFTSGVSTLPGTEVTASNRFILFRLRAGSRTGNQLIAFLNAMNQKTIPITQPQPE